MRVLVLGAGFGGLSLATELRKLVGGGHEIVVVDRQEHFLAGLRKLWAITGLTTLQEGRRSRTLLNQRGIRFLQRHITSIDPAARGVTTDAETLDGDYLVVALGAESRPDLVPGFADHVHNLYDVSAVPGLETALARFSGGRIAVIIAGVPYKCPPAPYECAMLLDAHLRDRGLRDRTEITVATVQPMLLPNAGLQGSTWLGEQLTSRGISSQAGRKVVRFEPGKVVFADGELEAELMIGVPPHRPPPVVKDSGLTRGTDWVGVDPATLRTSADRVFAIGDVTHIKLANGLALPKAGLFAELEGKAVASSIAAEVSGAGEPLPFDGRGYCFMEMSGSEATLIEGDFFARPEPRVSLRDVSARHAEAKRRFETQRLEEWFGG